MYSAQEIIGNNLMTVIDSQGSIRKTFFWALDKQDKKKVMKLDKWTVYKYVKEFLPAFGYYKYRNADEGSYQVIQKNGRFVKIVGSLKDPTITDSIFDWTISTLEWMKKPAYLPDNLEQEVFKRADLFCEWTIKFLPQLPQVESPSNSEGTGKWEKIDQKPLRDSDDQAHVCFENGLVAVRGNKEPCLIPYQALPPELFIWANDVRPAVFNEELLAEGPHGVWWEFLQNLAKEDQGGKWVVNHGMLETLTTSYGYLLHNFYPPENRKAIILYDRTTEWKAGGNGKSIVAKSFNHIKPVHFVDMKQEKAGDNRFLLSGFTDDKRIVVLSDTTQEFKLENLYNLITDGFTVEDKGVSKYVIPEEDSPKLVITTNYTIDSIHRSDARRMWFTPVSTYYGTLWDNTKKTPADVHGGRLLDRKTWTTEDWSAFYSTCVHCLHEYLKRGLVEFDDKVLAERQLIKTTYGDETLLQAIINFVEEVAGEKKDGIVSKEKLMEFYRSDPELEKYIDYSSTWKVQRFKAVAIGIGYQVNPGRADNRFQQLVNGKPADFYRVVLPIQPETTKTKVVEEEPKQLPIEIEPDSPFANFIFGEDEDESNKEQNQ